MTAPSPSLQARRRRVQVKYLTGSHLLFPKGGNVAGEREGGRAKLTIALTPKLEPRRGSSIQGPLPCAPVNPPSRLGYSGESKELGKRKAGDFPLQLCL